MSGHRRCCCPPGTCIGCACCDGFTACAFRGAPQSGHGLPPIAIPAAASFKEVSAGPSGTLTREGSLSTPLLAFCHRADASFQITPFPQPIAVGVNGAPGGSNNGWLRAAHPPGRATQISIGPFVAAVGALGGVQWEWTGRNVNDLNPSISGSGFTTSATVTVAGPCPTSIVAHGVHSEAGLTTTQDGSFGFQAAFLRCPGQMSLGEASKPCGCGKAT